MKWLQIRLKSCILKKCSASTLYSLWRSSVWVYEVFTHLVLELNKNFYFNFIFHPSIFSYFKILNVQYMTEFSNLQVKYVPRNKIKMDEGFCSDCTAGQIQGNSNSAGINSRTCSKFVYVAGTLMRTLCLSVYSISQMWSLRIM